MISMLKNKIRELQDEIITLKNQPITFNRNKVKEIHYEKDPYLIEQNTHISRELEKTIQEEQKAKMDLQGKMKEIGRLNQAVQDLKSRPVRTVIKEKKIEVIKEVTASIAVPVEKLMDMYKKRKDQETLRAYLTALYYFRLFNKYRSLLKEKREKVLINQKLEVVDGTFEVWVSMRQNMVDWLMDVFVRSADRAHTRKMNSFVLFKCNMQDIKNQAMNQNILLAIVFARLKNLIYDDIPRIDWEVKYQIPKDIPKEELMRFEPE